jgi:predicted nucleic acid-binding protein
MKVLLDTNVILDLVLRRAPWVIAAERIWEAHRLQQIEACVFASALTDIFTSPSA